MIRIENLRKRFGRFKALDGLSLEINDGDIFGFVGPNGAGKTTTMRICAGLLKADSGAVYIDDVNVLGKQNEIKQYFGYMPDFFGVYDNLKVIEYMEFFAAAYGMYGKDAYNLSCELIELVNLGDKKDFMVDTLSRGMKQRLCLARCLIHNPSLLVLDEPASGLDPKTRIELKEILKNLQQMGKTILISSHILTELAEMCNAIGIVDKGKTVLQGNIDSIMSDINAANPVIVGVEGELDSAVRFLKEQVEVKDVIVEDGKLNIKLNGKEDAQLLRKLIMNDIVVTSFIRKQSNLETLFMNTVGKSEVEK